MTLSRIFALLVMLAVFAVASLLAAYGLATTFAWSAMLGSCRDGECELIAGIVLTPLFAIFVFVILLLVHALVCARRPVQNPSTR